MQCEHVLHSTMQPLGLESEFEPIPETVSGNVKPSGHITFQNIFVLNVTLLYHPQLDICEELNFRSTRTELGRGESESVPT